jgi:hypothetical protein
MRRVAPIAIVILSAVLAGCPVERHVVTTTLGANDRAVAVVTGSSPRIAVENSSPGTIRVTFEAEGESDDMTVDLSMGKIERTLAGPVRITLENISGEEADIEIRTKGAEGVTLEWPADSGGKGAGSP